MTPDRIAVVLRNRGEILACRPEGASGHDRSTMVLAPVPDGPDAKGETETTVEMDPVASVADRAREFLRDETCLADAEVGLVRVGDPVRVRQPGGTPNGETAWIRQPGGTPNGDPAWVRQPGGSAFGADASRPDRVVPVLFDCERRSIAEDAEDAEDAGPHWEWIAPPALLEDCEVPWLWQVYDAVRPAVSTVAGDTDHGSTALSVRALEVLRDEAALAVLSDAEDAGIRGVARDLIAGRPSMTAVHNRINHVLAAADGENAASIATAAHEGIGRAIEADGEAATNAATRIAGDRVATLSRSGTVLEAIAAGDPSAVLVAESRPGREGVTVAKTVAADCEVTLTTDAAFPGELVDWGADALLVGADTVLPDGRVVNKVGTYPAAAVATREGTPVLVVTSADKVSPDAAIDPEPWHGDSLYEGTAPVSIANPTFEVTPAACIDAVVTERGSLDAAAIETVAAEHRRLAAWNWAE